MDQTASSWSEVAFGIEGIWAIRIRLQIAEYSRDLALFNLAIESKLRGRDLVSLKVKDVARGGSIFHNAIVMQQKTYLSSRKFTGFGVRLALNRGTALSLLQPLRRVP